MDPNVFFLYFFSFSLLLPSTFCLISSHLPQYELAGVSGATPCCFHERHLSAVASISSPKQNPKVFAPPSMLQSATQKLQPTTTKASTRRCRRTTGEQRPRPAMEQATTWSCDRGSQEVATGNQVCWNRRGVLLEPPPKMLPSEFVLLEHRHFCYNRSLFLLPPVTFFATCMHCGVGRWRRCISFAATEMLPSLFVFAGTNAHICYHQLLVLC